MRTIRGFAIGGIALIVVYFIFRAIASNCAGAACDAYIPVSALIPLLIFLAVAIAGALATAFAGRGSTWFAALLALTIVGVIGPVAALLILTDSPDAFVAVATVIELLVASTVLAYSFLVPRAAGNSPARPLDRG
ncbi:MAG TPA: hypothetical protein VNA65_10945 [Candidatus Dormibacteraeota bacterium]|nr:hypothetical protein [Candidatus Dormibacteraeota bacterium]